MLRLGLLASHRGGGVRALVTACRAGDVLAEPCIIISNNRTSPVLAYAAEVNVPHIWIGGAVFVDPSRRDDAILSTLRAHGVELVVLLGYLKQLGARTVSAYRGRILNIHPGPLPRFGGRGIYGLSVHEAVLASGIRHTEVTIHVVDEEFDRGPIVAAAPVPIEPGDDALTLAARVNLREHSFLAETLQAIALGRIALQGLPQ